MSIRLKFVCSSVTKNMEGKDSVSMVAVGLNDKDNEIVFGDTYANSTLIINHIVNSIIASKLIPGRIYNIDISLAEDQEQ